MRNSNLTKARKAKNDEFYTQLSDIEKELKHYKEHFKGKTVLCNADDPFESNFFKYFAMNFNHLGLKKLITTCYADSQIAYTQYSLLDEEPVEQKEKKHAYKVVLTHVEDADGNGALNMDDILQLVHKEGNSIEVLKGDGDFRSDECIEILKESDIVVTNPPFSLFREFIATLEKYGKKYLVLGNMNAITYKEIFSLIMQGKLWGGVSFNKTMDFRIPSTYELKATGYVDNDGHKHGYVPAISWFTNLDIKKRHECLLLYKHYSKESYPKYDNYDAIEVNKVKDIPCDYEGIMGVPITFLDKYNPDQFEILGDTQRGCHPQSMELKYYDSYKEMRPDGIPTGASGGKTNGNPNLSQNDGKHNYFINDNGHVVQSCYNRILIRNRHPEGANLEK